MMNDSDIKLAMFRAIDSLNTAQLKTCYQMIMGLSNNRNINNQQQNKNVAQEPNRMAHSDMEITDLDALDPRQKDPQWFAMDKLTGQDFHETDDKHQKNLMNPF